MAHRFAESEDQEDNFAPWMEVPKPTTLTRLWTYLHECIHLRSKISPVREGNNYSAFEAEADLGVLQILEAEGIKIPPRTLKSRGRYIELHAREDNKQFGAERSPLVIQALAEFDRHITKARTA
jgi:hypothetical protein